jgi:Fe-S cluster biogenesis protein NfuA
MKKISLVTYCFFCFLLGVNAQTLVEPYRSAQNWTHEGGNNTIKIENDKLNFVQTHSNPDDERIHRPLGFALSDTKWTMDFDFLPTAGAPTGVAHLIASLTTNVNDPITEKFAEPAIYTQNNAISVFYDSEFGGAENTYFLQIAAKHDNLMYSFPAQRITCPPNRTYYLRIERTAANLGLLSVFTDAARTQHWSGSPVCFAIDADIKGLQYLQHGVWLLGHSDRALTATIDNMQIANDKNTSAIKGFQPVISGNPFLCEGGSATLTAYQPNYTSYVWSDGSTSAILNPTQAGTYTVTVTGGANGCGSGTNTIKVEKAQRPKLRISGATTACAGSTTPLIAHDDTEIRPNSTLYTWQNGITNDTIQAVAGKYSVVATNIYGCTATAEQNIAPSAPIEQPILAIQKQTLRVHNPQANLIYQWQKNGIDLPKTNTQQYKTTESGLYRVCAKNTAECVVCSAVLWVDK